MALSPIFGGVSVVSGSLGTNVDPERPPSSIPAGFDSVLQFSSYMLQRVLASNLAQGGLATLSARVPYQPELVAPKLRAAIGAHLTPFDDIGPGLSGPNVEVLLLNPRLQTLRSSAQPPPTPGTGGGSSTVPGGDERLRRVVDLTWTLQVNLFRERLFQDPVAEMPRGTVGGSGGDGMTAGGRVRPVGGVSGGVLSTGDEPIPELPEGDRITLAGGTVFMHVPTDLVEFRSVLQFWLALNFEGVQPDYSSDDPILDEFLESSLATTMLAQAVGPLLNRSSVALSPAIALAGNLTPSQVASMQLPPLHIQDLIVLDDVGEVLSLCVSLGDDSNGVLTESTGVPSMVRSFLDKRDFAYYLSDKFFSPILAARWRANAIHAPIVADVPVEMPLDSDSEETGEGLARVQVNLSDTLQEGSIKASEDNRFGDPLRLVSEQTIHLLRLWYPNGDEVDDLGDLGVPATLPFVLSLLMFDQLPSNTQQTLQSDMAKLLLALVRPIYRPMLERFAIKEISGFSSSAMRALVVRWNLQRPRDTTVAQPTGGVLAEV